MHRVNNMIKKFSFSLFVGIFLFVNSCSSFEKQYYGKQRVPSITVRFSTNDKYVLTPEKLAVINFANNLISENVEVVYQRDLKEQASYIANQVNYILEFIKDELGLDILFKVKVYLIRLDYLPQTINVKFNKSTDTFSVPLFVKCGDEEYETILSENPFYPYLFLHELVELALVYPKANLKLDSITRFRKHRYYTRWFRDGLASYAEYLLNKRISSSDNKLIESKVLILHKAIIPQHPLFSLNRVGEKLFLWDQFDDDQNDEEYYNASLGLFLMIENKFGKEGIKRIVRNLANEKNVDGKTLIGIVNKTLETDVKKFVECICWPKLGMDVASLTPAFIKNRNLNIENGLYVKKLNSNSSIANAGLREGDVIVSIDDKTIKSNLDMELAILQSVDTSTKKIKINVDRFGIPKTVMLKLQ